MEELLKTATTNIQGRKVFTSQQKSYIVECWQTSSLNGAEFTRRYGLLYRWRKNSMRGSIMGIKHKGDLHSKVELDALRQENEQLKAALGEAHLDNRILKKKLEMDALREQKLVNFPPSLK